MAAFVHAEETTRDERAVSLVATIGLHALALFLILSVRAFVPAEPSDESMAVFDVVPPPVQLVSTPPPPEKPRPAPTRPEDRPAPAPAPAVKTMVRDRPRAAAPQAPDFTRAIALPAPAPLPNFADGVGTAGTTAGTGVSGGDGVSGGNGSGGNGAGGNGGGAADYLRADWIRKPTSGEWYEVWPQVALRNKRGGQVILSCFVRPNGQPKRCNVEHEEPKGAGFGRAAVALSSKFRLRPITRNGERLDLPVRIPLTFAIKGKELEASTPTLP